MTPPCAKTKYDLTMRLLHWLSALVILWATGSGFYSVFLDDASHLKAAIAAFNVSLTTAFIPIFLYRMVYRLRNKVPSYGNLLAVKEIKLAKFAHRLIYLLVFLVLLSGVLMMPRDIDVFHLFYLPHPIDNKAVLAFFKSLHVYSTSLLALAIVLHLMAVIKHELAGKAIFKRML